jgi:hypothetical protein
MGQKREVRQETKDSRGAGRPERSAVSRIWRMGTKLIAVIEKDF